MHGNIELQPYENLRRWQQSGEPFRWVEAHQGRWNHRDWLTLLKQLRQSEFWPLEPAAVGLVLEGLKPQWVNLRSWVFAGKARQWVEVHQGKWNHEDWLALLRTLQHTEYWPVDPDRVGLALEEARRQWHLRRWDDSGALLTWVRSHQGVWDHDAWLNLLEGLRQSEFWPIDPDALGQVLERTARTLRRLRGWQESGEAWRWVESHQGQWDQSDWLSLLGSFQWAGLGRRDSDFVGRVVREVHSHWCSHREDSKSAHAPEGMDARQSPHRQAA
jgi:hypothetical protein